MEKKGNGWGGKFKKNQDPNSGDIDGDDFFQMTILLLKHKKLS